MSLQIKENNSVTIACVVRNGAGAAQDITGWTFQFRVDTPAGDLVFDKLSANSGEITITDAPTGRVSVQIDPADTAGKHGSYKYEFKGTDGIGNKYTLDGPSDLTITPTII